LDALLHIRIITYELKILEISPCECRLEETTHIRKKIQKGDLVDTDGGPPNYTSGI
jgi:hypothetical protein